MILVSTSSFHLPETRRFSVKPKAVWCPEADHHNAARPIIG